MKDFQAVLKLMLEADDTSAPDPSSFAPPKAATAFAGKVEDASNAAEAFGAFTSEHKGYYNAFKKALNAAEQQLEALHGHAVSFNRSMGSRPDPSTFAAPARPAKFDRSRVAALQSDLSGMKKPPVPGAGLPENYVTEADAAAQVKTSDFIKQAKEGITAALAQYEQGVGDLLKRTKTKMGEFAGQASGMAANQEQLQKKVEELNASFEQANTQVQELAARVQALEGQGRPEDQSEIKKLTGDLASLAQALEAKKAEAEELAQSLGSVATRASDNMQDMLAKIDELEKAGEEMEAAYEKLHKAYTSLHQRAKDQQMIGTPEHVKNYGKFDLLEHLSRAKRNEKKNAADW